MSRSNWVKIATVLLLGAIGLAGSGCGATRATATYLKNRALDLGDPFPVGVGMGVGASGRATNFLQVGGVATAKTLQYRGRVLSDSVATSYEFGFSPFFHFRNIENTDAASATRTVVLARTNIEPTVNNWIPWEGGNWLFLPERVDYSKGYDRDFWDFGLAVYGFVGIEFVFNPISTPFEIADFFAGIFTFDLAGDDEQWVGPRLFDTAPPEEAPE